MCVISWLPMNVASSIVQARVGIECIDNICVAWCFCSSEPKENSSTRRVIVIVGSKMGRLNCAARLKKRLPSLCAIRPCTLLPAAWALANGTECGVPCRFPFRQTIYKLNSAGVSQSHLRLSSSGRAHSLQGRLAVGANEELCGPRNRRESWQLLIL